MKASPELMRQLSNVDELLERGEAGEFAGYFDQELTARAIVRPRGEPERPQASVSLPSGLAEARDFVLSEGQKGLEKIRKDGENADLSPSEEIGVEAIVLLTGRPAILIQRGALLQVPPEWKVLDDLKDGINRTLQSIGRIEVAGHPDFDWLGTGFLVADDVIMTNRHVAREFAEMVKKGKWSFMPGMSGSIDYTEEFGVLEHAEFELSEVIAVHDKHDLALLRVEPVSRTGGALPSPLTIASMEPATVEGRKVYVCGYPASDGRRNDPDEMLRIFSSIFNVKRLQPGELRALDLAQNAVTHDCSTLGGNSGSPVIDLETNQVFGLHFGGRYRQANFAVALWQLRNDPLLKKAKINFD